MINYDLTKIKALAFDVDGVLSDARVLLIGEDMVRTANTKDGYALQLAAKRGLQLAIITGGNSPAIRSRYERLGVADVFLACKFKTETLRSWMQKYDLSPDEVLYMGDDIPDYLVMKEVGCCCCPSDAVPEIKAISTYVSAIPGGQGCVRDVVEQVLKAHNLWMSDVTAFGW